MELAGLLPSVAMIRFSETAAAIGAQPGKLAKVRILAEYLGGLDDDDLAAATRFFAGSAVTAGKRLAIGYRTIVAAAERVWGFDAAALRRSYRAHGDIGDALGPLARPPLDLGLFRDLLTPARLAAALGAVADASGPRAGARRTGACEAILAACATPLEATFVVKILAGELRIGLAHGLVVDAVAEAFGRDGDAVRRAVMADGDLGAIALAAKRDALQAIAVRYFRPIGFMLASPVAVESAPDEIADAAWFVEDKFDGIRAQLHVSGGEARLFSRTFADISGSFPELRDAARGAPLDAIIDGEIVARRDGKPLPFRYLQPRLQRKDPSIDIISSIPVAFVAFDALAEGDALLVDEPFHARRSRLERIASAMTAVEIAPAARLERSGAPVAALFDEARARGNEGLMLKRGDSPYFPGRRGKWWLKIKRELATLDVVVVAVEWGHGKRKDVLSDYTFAVRDRSGDGLLTIGKAYTGLTDREIADQTRWFLAHARSEASGRTIAVEPSLVIEVAFDIVQESALHESGFALRFPRIVRLRPDKSAADANTIADVEQIYAGMLGREGLTP